MCGQTLQETPQQLLLQLVPRPRCCRTPRCSVQAAVSQMFSLPEAARLSASPSCLGLGPALPAPCRWSSPAHALEQVPCWCHCSVPLACPLPPYVGLRWVSSGEWAQRRAAASCSWPGGVGRGSSLVP